MISSDESPGRSGDIRKSMKDKIASMKFKEDEIQMQIAN